MDTDSNALTALIGELSAATGAKKCHRCGCFKDALAQLHRSLPSLPEASRIPLRPILSEGESRLVPIEYDCLGCAVCWPANALNLAADAFPGALATTGATCPTDIPDRMPGWPPFPGNFRVLDAAGDVAVCVLTSEALMEPLVVSRPSRAAIVGSVYTENLGLERMIANLIANTNITALVVCGADSRQRVGHLPGQSLMSLAANGVDERGRIVGAQGRRPVLKNIAHDAIEMFRREISIIDRIGVEEPSTIMGAISNAPRGAIHREARDVGPHRETITAETPTRLVLDPLGYFVVLPDRTRGRIVVEHYSNKGVLSHVIEGERAADLLSTVVARELVSRLDHAAYLGKELALAERALRTGEAYVQDAAPEPACGPDCGCRAGARRTAGGSS